MACRVCRARKVKCDGRPGGCLNCERLDLVCDEREGNGSGASPERRRKRTYRSCSGCRAAKAKCDGERPACLRCRQRAMACVYSAAEQPVWTQTLRQRPSSVVVAASVSSGPPTHRMAAGRLSPVPTTDSADISEDISWLLAPQLPPSPVLLRRLIHQYFANVHPLRCFGFVHKPSFLRQLDAGRALGPDEDALLHVICAHGAKFCALEYSVGVQRLPNKTVQAAGHEWAKTAERLIMVDYGRISVASLMTAVLLYDYRYRLGDFGHAFIISGFTTRMSHALQLNLEYTPRRGADGDAAAADRLSPTEQESRRRLMWACYVIDAWAGSGVDQLTLLREDDLRIPLPCHERDFLLQRMGVGGLLGDDRADEDEDEDDGENNDEQAGAGADDSSLLASYVRLVAVWKRVARYVKHLDTALLPWLPGSEFASLDHALRRWRRRLPASLAFSQPSIYARVESGQLGALALLHCTYYNAMCDLYRIAVPELFSLRHAFVFPPEQAAFVQRLQAKVISMARGTAVVLAETAARGAHFLSDSMTPMFAYNSSRLLLYSLVRLLDLDQPGARATVEETVQHVQNNNCALRMAAAMMPLSEPLLVTTERWLQKLHTGFPRHDAAAHIGPPDTSDMDSVPDTPPQNTPDDVLHPLSLFRLARKTVRDQPSATYGGLPPLRDAHRAERLAATPEPDPLDAAAALDWEGASLALGLHDLQGYPYLDMDGMGAAWEDNGLTAWLGGERS